MKKWWVLGNFNFNKLYNSVLTSFVSYAYCAASGFQYFMVFKALNSSLSISVNLLFFLFVVISAYFLTSTLGYLLIFLRSFTLFVSFKLPVIVLLSSSLNLSSYFMLASLSRTFLFFNELGSPINKLGSPILSSIILFTSGLNAVDLILHGSEHGAYGKLSLSLYTRVGNCFPYVSVSSFHSHFLLISLHAFFNFISSIPI